MKSVTNSQPKSYELHPAYPNPFNPQTLISYEIPKECKVSVIIHDMLGKEVEKIVDEKKQSGVYSLSWDASDKPSGIYFVSFKANYYNKSQKLILLK